MHTLLIPIERFFRIYKRNFFAEVYSSYAAQSLHKATRIDWLMPHLLRM